SGWELPAAPLLADCAYGDDTAFRTRLQALELEYVVAVSAQISVYGPETTFSVPERNGSVGRRRSVARPDRKPESVRALAARLRWTIELDYRQLKGELGLDHYEGRSYAGFHHHTALVTCAHAFLTLERLDPKARRPA